MRQFLFLLRLFMIAWALTPKGLAWADTIAPPGMLGRGNFGVTGMPRPPAEPIRNLADPGIMCRRAVDAAGRAAGVPDHLMSAIARIESGRRSPDGSVNPWPWSINAEGVDHVYDTREAAVAGVRAFQANGMRSIDVGCMQVNLLHHPTAFATLEQGFEPAINAAYAAGFLMQLFQKTGNWPKAVANYHSSTPELGDAYQRKVMAVLGEETQKDLALIAAPPPASNRFAGSMADGHGALMLGNRAESARIIPLAGADNARTLDAYRAAPVRVAARIQ